MCRIAAAPWISSCTAGGISWATANQITLACAATRQATMARVPTRAVTSEIATAENRTVARKTGSNRVVMVCSSSPPDSTTSITRTSVS